MTKPEVESNPEEGVSSRWRWQDGRYVDVVPGVFNCSLKVGLDIPSEDGFYDEVYDYRSEVAAFAAVFEWVANGYPEPAGWLRHMPSGRRRPDGDSSREYVRP